MPDLVGIQLSASERQSAQAQLLPKSKLTVKSIIQADLVTDTARLPLYRATVKGQPVWYVLTEVSDARLARARGLNFSPKLRNLTTPNCPGCVQTVRSGENLGRTVVRRPGAPDFRPARLLVPGPDGGFPPAAAAVGAVAQPTYSPFVRISGTNIVYNAPIVATGNGPFDELNHRNTHDRLFAIDTRKRTVDMGFIRAFAPSRASAGTTAIAKSANVVAPTAVKRHELNRNIVILSRDRHRICLSLTPGSGPRETDVSEAQLGGHVTLTCAAQYGRKTSPRCVSKPARDAHQLLKIRVHHPLSPSPA